MDAIRKAIAQLTVEIIAREDAIKTLSRLLPAATRANTKEAKPQATGQWTDAQRKAASRRAKAQWRKRKALKAQNRAKVTKVAPKKKG